MSQPLGQPRAASFKTLTHPAWVRAPRLLREHEHSLADLLAPAAIAPAPLSQQLAVLRHARLMVSRERGSTVSSAASDPRIADLLAASRAIRPGVLSEHAELLEDLRASTLGART